MSTQVIEQVEFFSEAELESLEFVPEELEAIEAERVPDLDSISFENVAEEMEAILENRIKSVWKALKKRFKRSPSSRPASPLPASPSNQRTRMEPRPAGQAARPAPSYHSTTSSQHSQSRPNRTPPPPYPSSQRSRSPR